MMRKNGPGYRLLAMHDPAGRRGLWYRVVKTSPPPGETALVQSVEICSGREGDDGHVVLKLDESLTPKTLYDLLAALEYGEGPLMFAPREEPEEPGKDT